MHELPNAFVDIKAKRFPLTIEFLSVMTGEVLHTLVATEPGALHVPGQDFFQEPVGVRITTGDGQVVVSES